MATKTALTVNIPTILITQWEQSGAKLTALAEKFPENAYELKPAEGVRTFAGVLRHVAFWNRYVAAVARGETADETANELPKAEYQAKEKILDALRKSIADASAALKDCAPAWEPQTAEMVVTFLEHNSEHYGQLVAYARWKGVVPPASQT